MSAMGPQVVAEARRWLGTPYLHQASVRGSGADCLGLIRGVWRAVLGAEPEVVPAYTPDWSEAAGIEALWQAGARHLRPKPLAAAAAGDVLLFRMRDDGVAKHLGLAARTGGASDSFIHAYTGHGVVESPLSGPWLRRIVARFEFPEGAA